MKTIIKLSLSFFILFLTVIILHQFFPKFFIKPAFALCGVTEDCGGGCLYCGEKPPDIPPEENCTGAGCSVQSSGGNGSVGQVFYCTQPAAPGKIKHYCNDSSSLTTPGGFDKCYSGPFYTQPNCQYANDPCRISYFGSSPGLCGGETWTEGVEIGASNGDDCAAANPGGWQRTVWSGGQEGGTCLLQSNLCHPAAGSNPTSEPSCWGQVGGGGAQNCYWYCPSGRIVTPTPTPTSTPTPTPTSIPVNGVCGTTHYSCTSGTSVSNVSGTSAWTWGCNGSNGGTSTGPTDCSENKPLPPPTGQCINTEYNGSVPQTPVTWTWTGATGIQITKDYPPDSAPIEDWIFNGGSPSPLTITSANSLTGKGIPPGHTVYARVTYDFATFSDTTTLSACTLPTAYPTINVSGSLEQNSGGACYVASPPNTFNSPSIVVNPNPSIGVTSSCNALPLTDQAHATGFNCTVTIDNRGEVLAGRPEPPPNTTLTLNASVNSKSGVWASSPSGGSGGTCNLSGTTLAITTSGTPYSKDIAFDYTGDKWYKIKDSSFNGVSVTSVTVPASVTKYDTDDDGLKYFASGIGGSVLNTSVQPATSYSNPNNWHIDTYNRTSLLNPSVFSDYIRSRKSYESLSSIDDLSSKSDGIYLLNGPISINNARMSYFAGKKVVLIITGNVSFDPTLTNNIFNPTNTDLSHASLALIVNGEIDFTNVKEADGIFVANTIETGSPENQGLKIKGNLVGLSSSSGVRSWNDTSRPGLFVVFDPKQYIDLLPYLSIAKYDQTIQ